MRQELRCLFHCDRWYLDEYKRILEATCKRIRFKDGTDIRHGVVVESSKFAKRCMNTDVNAEIGMRHMTMPLARLLDTVVHKQGKKRKTEVVIKKTWMDKEVALAKFNPIVKLHKSQVALRPVIVAPSHNPVTDMSKVVNKKIWELLKAMGSTTVLMSCQTWIKWHRRRPRHLDGFV